MPRSDHPGVREHIQRRIVKFPAILGPTASDSYAGGAATTTTINGGINPTDVAQPCDTAATNLI